ncbi:MAG TPA: YggT family protein [Nitrospiria bacterium]|nr:YggT family protein [Nitrospiria bacterium]
MFVAGNFLSAVATVLDMVLEFYKWVVIIAALLSWVNPDPYNPIVQFLRKITEPVLYPIRRAMGGYGLGIDLSPLVVILAIIFLQQFLVHTLRQAALQFH